MRIVAPALACLLMTVPAAAAPPAAGGEAVLTGEATIGSEARHVTLRLACDPAHAGISAVLTVPRFADLTPRFAFDAFEGPDGTTKPLTAIRIVGANGVRSVIAPATGAVAADPATSYTFTVAGPKRTENPLRGIATGFAEAGARIVWTQSSPRAGDASVIATFTVTEPAPLRTALEPCFGP
ncbi:hypothetical protein [Methylobacterium persicinum]|uniref:YcnI-like domain-containing protein n=1 Tax=Methylobacterium persicinum TaxID=374426 RepID=A0ABU0HUG5_9HYPH|nr:hypothetical protein [Methylobacterium persicinum]MDQ0445136.1 hypothetical protein [Methylobacterium persicinum]GJE38699.1 hypothetical protein KHHGKMAE_2774 [Methylobacterium persicinum]